MMNSNLTWKLVLTERKSERKKDLKSNSKLKQTANKFRAHLQIEQQ